MSQAAACAAVTARGLGFVSLTVLGRNSQAIALRFWKGFLKSHQRLFSNISSILTRSFRTTLRFLPQRSGAALPCQDTLPQAPTSGANTDTILTQKSQLSYSFMFFSPST